MFMEQTAHLGEMGELLFAFGRPTGSSMETSELGSGIRFGEAKHQALSVQVQDSRQFVFALRTLPALHRSRMCVQTLLKSINAMSFLSPIRLQLKRLKKLFRN